MVKSKYSVDFEDSLIDECRTYYTEYGGKLNPLLVHLLQEWLKDQKKKAGKK